MENTATSLLTFAKGAIMEQFDMEAGKVVANILDVNTEPKKKRQLILTVDFIPSADRSSVVVSAIAKSKLQPNNAIQTSLYVGMDTTTGEVCATEMVPNIPGQLSMSDEEQEAPKTIKMVVGGNR